MRYDVLAIVGTLDPHIASVPWISLDSLISGEGNHYLMRLFGSLTTPEQVAEINNLLLKNFAPTSDRIRHHPRHQQSHQPR